MEKQEDLKTGAEHKAEERRDTLHKKHSVMMRLARGHKKAAPEGGFLYITHVS